MPVNAINDSINSLQKIAFKKIAKFQFPYKRLIGPRNIYLKNTISLTNGFDRGIANKDHINQYIAASIIPHCYDGWNFLSRAIESLLNGDTYSCIHLAYYSELRAVMCIMASYGIGIFDKRHIYFDHANSEKILKKSTHEIACELLKEWGNSNSLKESVFKIIKVNSNSLENWIAGTELLSESSYVNAILKDWIEKWSIDLNLKGDQILRNEMSYRPHFKNINLDFKEIIEKICSIWSGLEPIESNRFRTIDLHLSRIAIEEIFRKTSGREISDSSYLNYLTKTFNNLGESSNENLLNFFKRTIEHEDHFIIAEAKKDFSDKSLNIENPLPIICRSILLLRIATGMSNNFINESSVELSSLNFWWDEMAFNIGITPELNSGIMTCDLYSEISSSINELNSNLSNINTAKDAYINNSQDLNIIKQFQRPCFWGLGL